MALIFAYNLLKKALKGVKGYVVDEVTKSPIINATIQVEGINHNVTSYMNGDFWRILSPGHYWLIISHPRLA